MKKNGRNVPFNKEKKSCYSFNSYHARLAKSKHYQVTAINISIKVIGVPYDALLHQNMIKIKKICKLKAM